ncbi:hypothetical protein F183_A00950 [Bryobacterales bacterium F-183]|nr:hypothetical protein F183_A00950 [Bryobacterales bacterium F-183]
MAGAWLIAAPSLFSQTTPLAASELLRYSLDESMQQIHRALGAPAQVADAGPDLVNWFYKTDVYDQHEHSHQLLFRKSDGKLLSVTRNFHFPVNVDALFPEGSATRTYQFNAEWGVRVRETRSGQRLIIAMGATKAGATTTQIALMRPEAVRIFLPWLARQMSETTSAIPRTQSAVLAAAPKASAP